MFPINIGPSPELLMKLRQLGIMPQAPQTEAPPIEYRGYSPNIIGAMPGVPQGNKNIITDPSQNVVRRMF